jgi:hypothetical protein
LNASTRLPTSPTLYRVDNFLRVPYEFARRGRTG